MFTSVVCAKKLRRPTDTLVRATGRDRQVVTGGSAFLRRPVRPTPCLWHSVFRPVFSSSVTLINGMKYLYGLLALSAVSFNPVHSQPFTGRWDLTITTPQDSYPSWMESLGHSEVRIVGRVASVHPASDVKLSGSHLTFTTSEWFGKPTQVTWDMTVKGGKITGTQKREDGVEGRIAGVHAPALKRKTPPAWSDPEPLFNGKDLTGWTPDNPAEN